MKRVVIIGGGTAGLLCGYFAAKNGASVLIVDKNARPGRKMMISGKGRCNLTNNCDVRRFMESVTKNASFLYSALYFLPPQRLMELVEASGLPLKTERGNRVFPVSDKAVDVVDAVYAMAKSAGCEYLNAEVKSLIVKNGAAVGVDTSSGKLEADAVVVATGGASYTRTGSTGDGYRFAKEAGHTVEPIRPSLVPLVTAGGTAKRLMGLSLKNVALTLTEDGKDKPVFGDFGEMLFTHFGLSGPMVLSASAHMEQGKRYSVSVDLKPALTTEELSKRIARDFAANPNKDFANSLDDLLPKKMIPVIVDLSGIDPHKKVNSVTREERTKLAALLKKLDFAVTGTRPVEEAIITSGGVNVKEIDPKTMESKLVKGLYFAGEVIDVDALTGGYNMHIAMATGALAGENAAK
ncbi:MAG: NAD(P)/FAD-dependent oxidoreductase [Clostridia bacterium]|nr:NAD(P)/FAD-dependent oxidoreductase [Clostridia bacterium]